MSDRRKYQFLSHNSSTTHKTDRTNRYPSGGFNNISHLRASGAHSPSLGYSATESHNHTQTDKYENTSQKYTKDGNNKDPYQLLRNRPSYKSKSHLEVSRDGARTTRELKPDGQHQRDNSSRRFNRVQNSVLSSKISSHKSISYINRLA